MLNIVLFGPPGAGKGTISDILVAQEQLVHISTGNMLRKEIQRGTSIGEEAARLINKGNFVSDEVVVTMVRNYIKSNLPCKGFIFDGFPRTTAQAEQLDILMAEIGSAITMLISLEVEEVEIIRRIQHRAKIEGRADDADIDIILNRIATYHRKTEVISDYYKAQGKAYAVNGNVNPENTLEQILKIFNEIKTKE